MERAIAYIRVSSDRQVDGNSLTTQEKRVWEHVSKEGYELEKIFVGKGESAKSDRRPELQEMLAYAKKRRGAIHVLIFPKVDRFARYTEDYFHLKRSFRVLGIRVESVDERFDDSPSGRFMESMLAATAQFDNDVRSERCKGGMREAIAQGRWAWGAPRGFRNIRFDNRATIEPDPITGPLIREAFSMLASGRFRPHAVRRWLTSKGVTLSRSHFYRMVHNKAYIGVIAAFGVEERAAPPFVPLVSESLFYQAQAAFRRNRAPKVYQRDNPDFPLRGTIRCPKGHMLTASWSAGRTRRYAYYRCKVCSGVNVRQEEVENAFLSALGEFRSRFQLNCALKKELECAWREDRKCRIERVIRVKKEIDRLAALQKAIVIKSAQGVLPDELARQQLDELGRQIAERRAETADTDDAGGDFNLILDRSTRFLDRIESFWRDGDLDRKKHIQAFFCPNGATLLIEGQSRTAKTGTQTGSRSFPHLALSHSADPMHESPNRKPGSRTLQTREVLQFFHELDREFKETMT